MDTGWLSPSEVISGISGDVAWTDPGNAMANDDSRATVELSFGQVSEYLVARGFNANIPNNAQVQGVEYRIRGHRTGDMSFIAESIQHNGVVGDTVGVHFVLGAAENVFTYGSSTSKWGMAIPPAIVNSATFGPCFQVQSPSFGGTALIDQIEMRVHYQPRSSLGLLGVG